MKSESIPNFELCKLSFMLGSDYGYAWPDAIQIKGHFVIQIAWVS